MPGLNTINQDPVPKTQEGGLMGSVVNSMDKAGSVLNGLKGLLKGFNLNPKWCSYIFLIN